jgi:RND family efflux transporter MFP subunit
MIASCKSDPGNPEKTANNSDSLTVILEKAHPILKEIQHTRLKSDTIYEETEVSGDCYVPIRNRLTISAPVQSFVSDITHYEGTVIYEGQVLAELKHPAIAKMQLDYLRIKAQHDYYIADFKRQGELTLDNAASIKRMQQAKMKFNMIEGKMNALKKELRFTGINPDKINPDFIQDKVIIYAPFTGIISDIASQNGSYVEAGSPLFSIIESGKLIARLSVPAEKTTDLKKGQIVFFDHPFRNDKKIQARIFKMANLVKKNRLQIWARFEKKHDLLKPGTQLNGRIKTSPRYAHLMPRNAVNDSGENPYVFIQTSSTAFRKIYIKTGIESSGYVEIIKPDTLLMSHPVISTGRDQLKSLIQY